MELLLGMRKYGTDQDGMYAVIAIMLDIYAWLERAGL